MKEQITKTMKLSETKQQFSKVVDGVFREKERVIVEKSGIPVAVIIPVRDFDFLRSREERLEAGHRAMQEFSMAFADVPLEELEGEVEKALAEVKRERREEAEQRRLRRRELETALIEFSRQFEHIPLDELEREVERVVAEARAELRAERMASPTS